MHMYETVCTLYKNCDDRFVISTIEMNQLYSLT